jgi:glycosyltransferase involved in cell wall biosynthesis
MDFFENDSAEEAPMFDLISSFLGPSPPRPVSEAATKDGTCSYPQKQHPHKQIKDNGLDFTCISGSESRAIADRNDPHKIIIFSKDRPWQLQQLLRSMRLDNSLRDKDLTILIVCKVTCQYKSGYDKVKNNFDDAGDSNQLKIKWLYECDSGGQNNSFAYLLESALYHPLTDPKPNRETVSSRSLVMFLTDDCILLEPIDDVIDAAESVLNNGQMSERILGFLTRLHPGVTFCQTKNEASPPPRSHLTYHQTESELKAFVYPQHCGSNDYSYPFDLSGGIYHQNTCINLLDEMQRFHHSIDSNKSKTVGYSHPNILEISGNNAIRRIQIERKGAGASSYMQHIQQKDLLAIPSQPALLILAVNRVQDICLAPIATWKDGADVIVSYSPELLATYLENDEHLDLPKYKATKFNSSHIGDVILHNPEKVDQFDSTESSFALSVLIPVHAGPPSAAVIAMKSILHQTVEDASCILPIQIVLVDDRCRDGSIDRMQETAQVFAREYQQSLEIRDRRHANITTEGRANSFIKIDIVQSPSPGVGAALNFGLQICKADFIARMDADDVSCPRRLITQLPHLKNNPTIHALGTSCVVFSEPSSPKINRPQTNPISLPFSNHSTSCNAQYNLIRTSVEPTDPGFVAWSMMFSCVMIHPSIMFRKAKIIDIGGYNQSDSITCTEDYDLWLRLIANNSRSVCSLPMIGVFHRKHSNRSTTDERSIRQREESTRISSQAMTKYCNFSTSLKVVEALKYPHGADLPLLNDAANLLCVLEKGFAKEVSPHLTKNEIDLVTLDCNARLGELATLSVEKFGRDAANGEAWNLWCERCPDLQMERLALLLHANSLSPS